MADDGIVDAKSEPDDEFDLDSEDDGDLEAAMQEALEAVEKAGRQPTAESSPGEAGPQSSANNEVEHLEEELADLRDRSARTLADFDNYRKRVERERAEDRRYANFEILGSFLTVVDNLERALTSDGPAEDLKAGVELIHRQIRDLLRSSGVERIAAVGKEFDPTYHEAVSQHPDPGVAVPTVSQELQAGYIMFDRLLRPATVKVAMPVEGESVPAAAGSEVEESPGRENE